jgi:hypothetical protein
MAVLASLVILGFRSLATHDKIVLPRESGSSATVAAHLSIHSSAQLSIHLSGRQSNLLSVQPSLFRSIIPGCIYFHLHTEVTEQVTNYD